MWIQTNIYQYCIHRRSICPCTLIDVFHFLFPCIRRKLSGDAFLLNSNIVRVRWFHRNIKEICLLNAISIISLISATAYVLCTIFSKYCIFVSNIWLLLSENNKIEFSYLNYPHTERTNTENSKQKYPEKELRGHNPNFHIHVSVSDLYNPRIDLPILLQEICGPILGIYKSLTETHEFGNWDCWRAIPKEGIHKWNFRCSAYRKEIVREKRKVISTYCVG